MNHRIEKLSTLLNENQTQLNEANKSKFSIEIENTICESNDAYSCSSTIKVEPITMVKSERFNFNSFIRNTNVKHAKKDFQPQLN
jgi:hypothetical protein